MTKSVLYVTSFIEKMYDLTGKNMIESFYNTNQEGDILICYEGFDFESDEDNMFTYDLTEDSYLLEWLEDNKDIIPKQFGGEALPQKRKPNEKLWNVKASKWFRKIASIKHAMEVYGDNYDYLIWVDCDCVFKEMIPISIHEKVLNNCGMFYYFGKRRERYDCGYETGFLGFNKECGGYDFIKLVVSIYEKEFRNIKRWDDGYVIRKVNELHNKSVKTKDIGGNTESPINYINPYYKYIRHNKGTHDKKKVFKI